MRRLMLCLLVVGAAVTTLAQLNVTREELLPLDPARQWSEPRFSPDGSRIYLTTPDYRGIWEFDLATQNTRQITADTGSGYAYALSADGSLLAYRRTLAPEGIRSRRQELVLTRLGEPTSEVLARDRKLPVPAFAGNRIVYREQPSVEKPGPADAVTLLGIEQTKLAVLVSGTRRLLDPLGTGRYIWPSLSPDQTRIAAVQMERGAFVCDLDGAVLALLGKCNTPSWTHDGRWIIGMDDRDDGHRVIASELVYVSPDGVRSGRLTATEERKELFPSCSPVDKRIVFSTLDGRVYLLTYQEEGR